MNDTLIQLFPLALWSLISIFPAIAVCGRIGKTKWLAMLVIIPFAGPLLFLFAIAYSKWTVTRSYKTQ